MGEPTVNRAASGTPWKFLRRKRREDDYAPYVVSDYRLSEIRAMFTERNEQDNWDLQPTPGTTMADLVGAVYDLLGERDDRGR